MNQPDSKEKLEIAFFEHNPYMSVELLDLLNDYKIIIFMETGANFGPQLLKYGADTVLSEFFPFYDFYGDTKYLVSKKDK